METIREIKSWFEAAVPHPTADSRAVQLGVYFEEVEEMVEAMGFAHRFTPQATAAYFKDRHPLYTQTVENMTTAQHVALLDALCDQIVTAIGVAHMFGFDIEAALREVNRSNWSKFDSEGNPIFDAQGKIKKGEGYTPPDLKDFV